MHRHATVEQFRVAGLAGETRFGFVTSQTQLPFNPVATWECGTAGFRALAPSRDFIGVFDATAG